MASSDFKTYSRRHNTEGDLLLEIELIDKILYLSDRFVTYTNYYEGLVLDWGDIDTDRQLDAGLSSIGDTEIILANQRMQFMEVSTHGERFSDLFNVYDFDYRDAVIYQIYDGLTYSSDAEELFKGQIRIKDFDINTVTLELIHKDDFSLLVPVKKLNEEDFNHVPQKNKGRSIPIPFGDLRNRPFCPMILSNEHTLQYEIASHQIASASLVNAGFRKYVNELDTFITVEAPNKSFTSNSDGANAILNDEIIGSVYVLPKIQGGLNDIDDWYKAVDGIDYLENLDTYCTIDGDDGSEDELSVTCGSLPNLGAIRHDANARVYIGIVLGGITGSGIALDVDYYDVRNSSHSAGTTFSDSDANSTVYYQFGTDNTPWSWSDLGQLEFYLKARAGFTVEVKNIFLGINFHINNLWAVIDDTVSKVTRWIT